MARALTPRQTIVVSHPEYGETKVKAAMNKLDALMEAARRWGARWTVIAHDVTFRIEEDEA